ncbi:hypothetical protein [Bacillus sp. 1P06AnD]|uniref:hypothetical protein n=1 Tax=Bacillus sp. 1P06AnD TaxID=3132208 RepID=UPI00399EFCAD
MEKENKNTHKWKKDNRDHPEQYPTDNESLFDKFESEQNVDPIPMEELKQNAKDEKDKHHTKDTSSSERKGSL